ncbi:unnamed protein product [Ceratitis capitata]|uniref:(Mediterranean fruit fly) hypothetical protein n=1 Tax=Ceratitis capitata TaxID=7213 RepID=A0A811UTP6_CERCA|nr:unnamed protein product [Ceratitis capitata]
MDSNNYLNFDSEQQMLNFPFDQDEFDEMLRRFDEEIQKLEMPAQPLQGTTETAQSLQGITFNKQLPTLEEPAQPLQGTTEMVTNNKRKRQRPSKTIQAEGSQQKANTENENKCMDLSKTTLAVVSVNEIIDTKGLLSVGKITLGQQGLSFEVNLKNEVDVQKLKFLIQQWIDDDLNCPTTSTQNNDISCVVEWIREDTFLKQQLFINIKMLVVSPVLST